jgi:hypothetical protein
MNMENLAKLKQRMRVDANLYDQSVFFSFSVKGEICGTACCIAGFCWVLQHGQPTSIPSGSAVWRMAKEYLDIDVTTADCLFGGASAWPEPFAFWVDDVLSQKEKVEKAIAFMDWLAAGNVVD